MDVTRAGRSCDLLNIVLRNSQSNDFWYRTQHVGTINHIEQKRTKGLLNKAF